MKLVNRVVGIVLLLIILVMSLVWLLSPLISNKVLSGVLEQQNLTLADDSSMRLNLFNTTLSISDVSWKSSEFEELRLPELYLDFNVWPLLRSKVRIDELRIVGLYTRIDVTENGQSVVGFKSDTASTDTPDDLGTEQSPDQAEAEAAQPPAVTVETIILEDATIDLFIEGQYQSVFIDRFAIEDVGFADNIATASIELALKVNPQLDFEENSAQYFSEEAAIPNVALALEFQTQVAATLGEETTGVVLERFAFQIDDLVAVSAPVIARFEKLEIESEQIALSIAEVLTLNSSLSVELSDIEVNSETQASVAEIKQLSLPVVGVNLDGNDLRIAIDSIALDDLIASRVADVPELAAWKQLLIETLKYDMNLESGAAELAIQRVSLDELSANVHVTEDGTIENLIVLGGEETETTDDTEAVENADSGEEGADSVEENATEDDTKDVVPFFFVVDEFALASPANIFVDDESISPKFKKQFVIDELSILNIDNKNIEEQLTASLKMHDNEYFKYDLQASAQPFKEKLNLNVETSASEFAVHEISPYISTALGFGIEAGLFDYSANAEIKEDIVDGKVKIKLRGAKFSSGDKPVQDELDVVGQAAIPLNVALNMLKDGNGDIELTIPVDGDINDPSFGVQYILGLVVKKAVMSQTKKHLVNTFIPYGQVLSIAYSAGSYALKVRFEDMVYAANEVDIAESHQEFIDQFTELLKKKGDLQVRVCPIAIVNELGVPEGAILDKAQQETLLELAKTRAKTFKETMTAKGIASSRLLLCSPEIETKTDAQPRLKFST